MSRGGRFALLCLACALFVCPPNALPFCHICIVLDVLNLK